MDNTSYLKLKEQVNHGNMELPLEVYYIDSKYSGDIYSHWHEEMEFLYILEGYLEIYIDFNKFNVSKGDFIIIPNGSIHYMKGLDKTKVSYLAIVFNLSLIEGSTLDYSQNSFITPIIENKLLFKNLITCNDYGHEDIVNSFNKIIEGFKAKDYGYQLAIKSYLFNILYTLLKENYAYINEKKDNCNNLIKVEKLKEVIKYIQTNYNKPISIKELADIAQYSEYHFLRFFKNETSKTCTQYINHFRIQKAAFLLSNTNLAITEIAYEVGFGDVSYFIRTFRKYMAISPTKFRKKEKL